MIALHGFLGRGTDWDGLLGDEWSKPNWLDEVSEGEDLLEHLATEMRRLPGDILLGYSMGGRIAMQMVQQDPARWRKVILVSAGPGLTSEAERAVRLESDRRWADRWRNEPFDEVLPAWNQLPVFAADPPDQMAREAALYQPDRLAAAMEFGSVARQLDFRPMLAALEIPVLWIAGGLDHKYVDLARECAGLNPRFQFTIVEKAGHRVPWSQPAPFLDLVTRFLEKS